MFFCFFKTRIDIAKLYSVFLSILFKIIYTYILYESQFLKEQKKKKDLNADFLYNLQF